MPLPPLPCCQPYGQPLRPKELYGAFGRYFISPFAEQLDCGRADMALEWIGGHRYEGTDSSGKLSGWAEVSCDGGSKILRVDFGFSVDDGDCQGSGNYVTFIDCHEEVQGTGDPETLPPACCGIEEENAYGLFSISQTPPKAMATWEIPKLPCEKLKPEACCPPPGLRGAEGEVAAAAPRPRGTRRAVEAGALETRNDLPRLEPDDSLAAEKKMVAAALDGDRMKAPWEPAAEEVRGDGAPPRARREPALTSWWRSPITLLVSLARAAKITR